MSDKLEMLKEILGKNLLPEQVESLMSELAIANRNGSVKIERDATGAVILTGNQNVIGDKNHVVINQGFTSEALLQIITRIIAPVTHISENANQPIESGTEVKKFKGNWYVIRSELEKRCHAEMVKPGMLIRIKSPEKMGKTFLMNRVLSFAEKEKKYRTAKVDLGANVSCLANMNEFLQWFCSSISDQIKIGRNPKDYWDKSLGPNSNCTNYFIRFFLKRLDDPPLVIAIDNFDYIFRTQEFANDLCGLLRSWFENSNTHDHDVWGNLRQIIVYSQEPLMTSNINQSPFNVGLPIELGELNQSQICELARNYGLIWTELKTSEFTNIVSGHPNLLYEAFNHLQYSGENLDNFLETVHTDQGFFCKHLLSRLGILENNPKLYEARRDIINSDIPVQIIHPGEASKLCSIGLAKPQGNGLVPLCDMYRKYFHKNLK